VTRSCSGCGTLGTRVDFCPRCSPNGRAGGDARIHANRMNLPPRNPAAPPNRIAPPPRPSKAWTLWFVPAGNREPQELDRVPTAADGQKLAETYNRLDWMAHQSLGADALIASGRRGTFILEPITR